MMLNMAPLKTQKYQACRHSGQWIHIPAVIYNNTLMLKEHCVIYMMEILDAKQQVVFLACMRAVIQQYVKKIVDKCENVSSPKSLSVLSSENDSYIAFDGRQAVPFT